MTNQKSKIENRPSRRLWQRAIRVGLLLLLAVTVLYVLLPWWMPRDLVRHAIEGRLSRQLGVGATIASLNVSWDNGLELGDLSVASPDGNAQPLMQVSRIKADFSPLRTLFTNKIAWLQVEGLRIFARMDDRGNFNLAPLGRLNADMQPKRIGITNATCSLQLPDNDKLLRVGISSVEIVEGRTTAIGTVTMSAQLLQDGGGAPLSLSAAAGNSDSAAAGKFSFSSVDLGQLPLPALLGLSKLAGRCSGALDLRLTDQGQVDRFSLDLEVQGLDVQPTRGPQLPVIDDATVRLAATYDIINSQVQVQSAYGKLPGVEFWASGIVSTDLASGAWEAVRQVRLQAKLCPAQLLALCRKELPGNLIADGTTEVNLAADGDEQRLTLSRLTIDATGNALRQGQKLLKPAGTVLTLQAGATLDKKTWGLSSSACAAVIGSNQFCCNLAIGNVKRLCEQLTQPGILNDPHWPGRLAGNIQCSAQCQVTDLPSLRQLAGGLAGLGDTAGDLQMVGVLEGKLQLNADEPPVTSRPRPAGPRFQLQLTAPAQTTFCLGQVLAKPAGSPLTLTASATVATDQWALKDVLIDLARGDAFVRLLEGQVQKLPQDQLAVRLTGRVDVDSAKPMMELLPASLDFAAIDGDVDGTCDLTFSTSSIASDFDLDFSQASVNVGDFFNKPLGQAASARMASRFRTGSGQCLQCPFLKLSLDSPQATANIDVSGTWAPDSGTQFDATASARIKDSGWLFSASPKLTQATPDAKVSGSVDMAGALSLHKNRYDGSLTIQAGAMDVSSTWPAQVAQPFQAVPAQFRKQAGSPLAFWAKGWAELDQRKQVPSGFRQGTRLELTSAKLTLAGCTVTASGKATLMPGNPPKPGSEQDQLLASLQRHEVATLDAHMKASAAFDESMADLNPQLRKTLAQFGISGPLLAQGDLHADAKELTLTAGVDADKLAVTGTSWFAKPADTLCQAHVELTAKRAPVIEGTAHQPVLDITDIHLNNLHMALGPVDVLASGDLDKEGWLTIFEQVRDVANAANPKPDPRNPKPALSTMPATQPGKERNKLQVAISLADASRLATISPVLAQYRLEGKAAMDLTYSMAGGGSANMFFHAGNLRGRFKDKDLAIDGPLSFGNMRLRIPPGSQSATIKSDGLEFRIGDNHGWFIADLKNVPSAATCGAAAIPLTGAAGADTAAGHAPNMAVQLVFEKLDDRDLATWFAGPLPQPQVPCEAQTQPVHPCSNMPTQRADELRRNAAQFLQAARPFLLAANLQADISIAHLRDYDAIVSQSYDMNNVKISGSLNHGRAAVTMLGGLDGGALEFRREVDLGAPQPRTTVMPAGVVASSQPVQPSAQTQPANPTVAYYSEYRGVLATTAFQPQLAMFFPGNTFNGEFSRTETVTVPLIDALAKLRDGRFPAKPVGTANTVTTNGVVEGRGAPDFVTKIFPGLSLTKYHYDKMTAFAEFNPDGIAVNDMIFKGSPIDMYIQGTTDAANNAKYEIGIILPSISNSPQWNHKFRQGRIPLLKFKGIIENGKIYDEEVSFPWPNETLFTVFLNNNILYRAWLETHPVRK